MALRKVGSKKAALLGSIAVVTAGLILGGCGGGTQTKKDEPEPVGSLKRTYTLMDDQGRRSGTLVLNPLGGAELLDVDGQVIGKFQSLEKASSMAAPAAAPEAVKETEAKEEEPQKKE